MKNNIIKYCYKCGSRLTVELIDGKKRFLCSACKTVSYINSKPCVGALIIEKDKILLTKRKIGPYKNYWDIPGGFLEESEHPEDGLHRELKEELGMQIKIIQLFDIKIDTYGSNGFPTLNIFYICNKLTDPNFVTDDVIKYKWFYINNLPDNMAFKSARLVLKKITKSKLDT
ncbi:MAG: NUDIX hydrolase [Bacteroidales bacterium]|nr:NUDIX hydrolase [Bacteroidales bacterium]